MWVARYNTHNKYLGSYLILFMILPFSKPCKIDSYLCNYIVHINYDFVTTTNFPRSDCFVFVLQ